MWINVLIVCIWFVSVSTVTVSGLEPTWGVGCPAAHTALNTADSNIRVRVREYVRPEPRESCSSPQYRVLCLGTEDRAKIQEIREKIIVSAAWEYA